MNNNKHILKDMKISYICKNQYGYFFNKKNVLGVGLGFKRIKGFYTDIKCITVFVRKKLDICNLCTYEIIPPLFKGFKTDVIESGIVKVNSLTGRCRPVINGYSISNLLPNAITGTCGCLVSDKYLYIMGNNHIMGNSNHAPIETPIVQPGKFDGGKIEKDVIGHLYRYVPLKFSSAVEKPENYVDCALCKVISRSFVSPDVAFIGVPQGIDKPLLNEDVKKTGRTTELTTGKIMNLSATFDVYFDNYKKTCLFKNQIITSKMTEKGDSGSLLFNDRNYALGFCLGSASDISLFNDISDVLNNLKVKLVTS